MLCPERCRGHDSKRIPMLAPTRRAPRRGRRWPSFFWWLTRNGARVVGATSPAARRLPTWCSWRRARRRARARAIHQSSGSEPGKSVLDDVGNFWSAGFRHRAGELTRWRAFKKTRTRHDASIHSAPRHHGERKIVEDRRNLSLSDSADRSNPFGITPKDPCSTLSRIRLPSMPAAQRRSPRDDGHCSPSPSHRGRRG